MDLFVVVAFWVSLLSGAKVGDATVFYAHERNAGGWPTKMACWHRADNIPRYLEDEGMWVAHRHLPCGSKLIIYNPRTHLSATARVGDRGPYAPPGRVHPPVPLLDLSPAVARILEHNGRERVVFFPCPRCR